MSDKREGRKCIVINRKMRVESIESCIERRRILGDIGGTHGRNKVMRIYSLLNSRKKKKKVTVLSIKQSKTKCI